MEQVIILLIAAFFGATILGTALVLVGGRRQGVRVWRSHGILGSLLLVTLLACAGAAWEEMLLRRFARQEGVERQSLIMRPVPLTADHQFTKNGREYLYRGILLPTVITCSLLLLTAFVSTALLHMQDLQSMAPAVWLHTVTAIAAMIVFSIWRFLKSIEFFV